jgi:hypothetical protein
MKSSLPRAQSLVGLKGYVANLTVEAMLAPEVIAKYHHNQTPTRTRSVNQPPIKLEEPCIHFVLPNPNPQLSEPRSRHR